jgi:hypothetical protein
MVSFLFGMFRAGFEPLSWRRDHKSSLRIEGRSVFLGGITAGAAAQNRRGLARPGTELWARRVFRPTARGREIIPTEASFRTPSDSPLEAPL